MLGAWSGRALNVAALSVAGGTSFHANRHHSVVRDRAHTTCGYDALAVAVLALRLRCQQAAGRDGCQAVAAKQSLSPRSP